MVDEFDRPILTPPRSIGVGHAHGFLAARDAISNRRDQRLVAIANRAQAER